MAGQYGKLQKRTQVMSLQRLLGDDDAPKLVVTEDANETVKARPASQNNLSFYPSGCANQHGSCWMT
jgi:hypothetical protein